jgi:serine/threonine protein kinase
VAGRDEVLHRDVAIKEVNIPIDLSAAEREELRTRTLREARTAARLSHPNVVQIYDVLGVDDRPWIVMEYVKSQSLQNILVEEGPVAAPRAAAIGLAILRALDAAHSAGVLHRDVKPGNVLIAEDGRVVLTDFGLATFDGGEGSVTRPGLVWGSPEYVAPERAKHGVSSVEADLWSLGATLYAAVEGASPYARSTAMASLTALATEKPPVPPTPARSSRSSPACCARTRGPGCAPARSSGSSPASPTTTPAASRAGCPASAPPRPARTARTARTADGGSVVPIASYSLPEPPPTDVSQPATLAPEPGPRGPSRRGWLIATAAVLLAVALGGATMLIVNRDPADAAAEAPAGRAPRRRPAEPDAEPTDLVTSARRCRPTASPLPRLDLLRGARALPDGGAARVEDRARRPDDPPARARRPEGAQREALAVPNGGAMAAARAMDQAWSAGTDNPPQNYKNVELRAVDYFAVASSGSTPTPIPGRCERSAAGSSTGASATRSASRCPTTTSAREPATSTSSSAGSSRAPTPEG